MKRRRSEEQKRVGKRKGREQGMGKKKVLRDGKGEG